MAAAPCRGSSDRWARCCSPGRGPGWGISTGSNEKKETRGANQHQFGDSLRVEEVPGLAHGPRAAGDGAGGPGGPVANLLGGIKGRTTNCQSNFA